MKVKDIIKKQTTLIVIAVAIVVVAAVSVSYAIFFDVKAGETQIITAGSLKLTLSKFTALNISEPKTDDEGKKSTPVSYTVENTDSNLPASYFIYVYAGKDNAVTLDKIKISIDGDATSGSTFKAISSIETKLEDKEKEPGDNNQYYLIKSDTIPAGAERGPFYIRVWVDEDALTEDTEEAQIDLNLYVVSEVNDKAN